MSKAFTKEDAAADEVVVPPRAPLPDGVPNYVTPRGLELLRTERQALELARAALRDGADAARLNALAARLFELERRIASAQCVEPQPGGAAVVRFGSRVTLLDEAGSEQRYQIVGVDEAEPSSGKIAFLSPLAKALLGAQVGDSVRLEKPGRPRELEVLAIE
ncbi:MAG TPA: GreA/GreB family elongation factor [Polyangiaceae bacterium]|nr:GreA/GreB family elongation factor [Polyangiaceae bacterium]